MDSIEYREKFVKSLEKALSELDKVINQDIILEELEPVYVWVVVSLVNV